MIKLKKLLLALAILGIAPFANSGNDSGGVTMYDSIQAFLGDLPSESNDFFHPVSHRFNRVMFHSVLNNNSDSKSVVDDDASRTTVILIDVEFDKELITFATLSEDDQSVIIKTSTLERLEATDPELLNELRNQYEYYFQKSTLEI